MQRLRRLQIERVRRYRRKRASRVIAIAIAIAITAAAIRSSLRRTSTTRRGASGYQRVQNLLSSQVGIRLR